MASAGHCWPWTDIAVSVDGIGPIGRVSFTTGDLGLTRDFALIRIAPELYGFVDPSLCRWGGPRGVASPVPGNPGVIPEAVVHYGWGHRYMHTEATRARVGLLPPLGWTPSYVAFQAALDVGDSGSALMTADGRAVGVIIQTFLLNPDEVGGASKIVSQAIRLDRGIALAEAASGHTYSLVLDPDWPVP